MNICTFFVSGDRYAIPLLAIEEIFRPVTVTPVPGADDRIAGLINLRGRSAAVIDLQCCISGDKASLKQPEPTQRMLLLNVATHLPMRLKNWAFRPMMKRSSC